MAGRLLPRFFDVVIDANGAPVAGAKMYTYVNNTTTLKSTWTTSALSVAQTNPIVADSAGRFPNIWGSDEDAYRVKLTNAAGTLIYQDDDVTILGTNPDGAITRDFGADGRLSLSATGGEASFEAGDPSPDNVGGKARIGGWAGTQADTIELDAVATSTTGSLAVAGSATIGNDLTVTDDVTVNGDMAVAGSFAVNGAAVINSSRIIKTSGYYYGPDVTSSVVGNGTVTADVIYYVPFSRAMVVDALGFKVTSALAGNARIGLYTSDNITGLPSTLIEGSGAISTASTGDKVAVLASTYTVTAPVWLAIVFSSACGVQSTSNDGTSVWGIQLMGASTVSGGTLGLSGTFAYAALPASAPTVTARVASGAPLLCTRSV